jgi:membrane-bound inhibitor of C-type lysozyme
MRIKFLILPLFASIFLVSCKNDPKSEEVIPANPSVDTEVVTEPKDSLELINTTIKNIEGEDLQLIVNNKDNDATVIFKGDSIKLSEKPAASGIWYANDHYELRGKGEKVTLTKDGTTIFTNE